MHVSIPPLIPASCALCYTLLTRPIAVWHDEAFSFVTVVSDLPSFEHADKSLTLQKYPDLQKNIISSQTID